ncbi:MAG: hypothetical protein ACREBC_36975 [Pyrinomonadaceae bacterium]
MRSIIAFNRFGNRFGRIRASAALTAAAVVALGAATAASALLLRPAAAKRSLWPGSVRVDAVSSVIEQSPSRQRLQAELVTLRPSGFEPADLTRPGGQFLLAVNNQSGLEDLTLWLERSDGVREREVRFVGLRLRWRERVNLPAGNYRLRVAGHPEWVCRITLTAR